MATDKKISELPAATEPLNDADLVEIVQGGVNKKAPKSAFGGSSGATIPFGATSGTTTLTATMSPTVTSYTNGDLYTIRAGATTTGDSTLNLDGVGAKNFYETPEKRISINDLVQGRSYLIQYDSALNTAAGGFVVIGEVSHEELMYRDAFDASGNAFPVTGGTGYQGAIRVGDLWRISVAGTLGGIPVADRDIIIALSGAASLSGWLILYGHESIDTKLATKVDEETFATLTFASPTVWNTNSRQSPLAEVTATGDFTINMTNVKDGSRGLLKITTSTVSAYTITFDTDFTNLEATTNDALTTYTFGADNGQIYILEYICDGTTLYWFVYDTVDDTIKPFARVSRGSAQSISNNDSTVMVSFTAESYDNSSIWAVSPNDTRLVVPGSGNKLATISIRAQWAANATGVRRNIPYLNGVSSGDIAQVFGNATAPIHHSTHQLVCAGGDYWEILCYQNSGGSLNLDVCVVSISFEDI